MIARYPRRQTRATYARTTGDFLVNSPDGFPSDYPPIWWMGADTGGGNEPIGPHGPWQNHYGRALPVVTRATALITGPLTSAPFIVDDPATPEKKDPSPRWLADPMLLRPDARIGNHYPAVTRLARSIFWASWIRSAIWWGEGAYVHVEDEQGQPVAGSLRLLNPLVLSTERDENGTLVWTLTDDRGGGLPLSADPAGYFTVGPYRYKITVLRNPHSPVDEDGRSLGVFGMHPDTFRLGRQIQEYTSGTFRSGIPAGYLKVQSPDMSQDKANKLKRDWLNAHGGDRRSIAVLNAVTEFVPLNLSPVDAALTEVDQLNIAETAYAFGLDPATLGVSLAGNLTYTNIRDAWLNHRDFGLAPWIAAVQDTLSAAMPGQQTVTVDLDGFANPTRQERYTALQTGINAGIITIDEAREYEGLPPLPKQPTPPQLVPFTGATTDEDTDATGANIRDNTGHFAPKTESDEGAA